MKGPTLELNINSASDLENVNYITKMNVYAVITLLGDKKIQKAKTGVDHYGGSSPNWNHAVKFSVNERLAREGRLTLVVGLFSSRLLGNKDIGEVEVPLRYLLPSTNGNGNGHEMKFVTYQVPASWASPSQHGYGPHCYMPQPPQPQNEEIRLQKAGLVVSALSLFRE
ncbi:PREDICTED: uncharacterized protein LOC106334152 isoform X2 [Brassica oleracea var. oleracea]|uniref:uncharacterized protein LOC106334152 isoform X2 n=1 Tax=Brassica oleracea var. oleracea TaxID=109376 RepID=UPI0006A72343|nr:PREDICTED: uncharacterized protein LOC106334152 isoform X2 [Brassica oleracea var. oleracea]